MVVEGGVGVGPVGSPAEHDEVTLAQTGRQMTCGIVVVTVVTGVLQGLLSPGRVPSVVSALGGLLSPGSVPRKLDVGCGEAKALVEEVS